MSHKSAQLHWRVNCEIISLQSLLVFSQQLAKFFQKLCPQSVFFSRNAEETVCGIACLHNHRGTRSVP